MTLPLFEVVKIQNKEMFALEGPDELEGLKSQYHIL
jgi:hypothetical protein